MLLWVYVGFIVTLIMHEVYANYCAIKCLKMFKNISLELLILSKENLKSYKYVV